MFNRNSLTILQLMFCHLPSFWRHILIVVGVNDIGRDIIVKKLTLYTFEVTELIAYLFKSPRANTTIDVVDNAARFLDRVFTWFCGIEALVLLRLPLSLPMRLQSSNLHAVRSHGLDRRHERRSNPSPSHGL